MEILSENVRFQYSEVLPSREISHLVFCFFKFTIDSADSAPIPFEIFPDGRISLLYRRNKRLNLNLLLVKGLGLEAFHTKVFADDLHWGVKFSPASSAKILRCDPKTIPTQPMANNKLMPHLTQGLLRKLGKCKNFQESVSIFENMLRNLQIEKSEVDSKIAKAVELIEESSGEAKISEIAESVNLSARQLERRFRKNSGMTPKQFSRVYRLRATAINLIETDINWASRAAELGFTDQAHLARELSSLTGRSPKAFAKRVKDIEYDDLVK